MNLESLDPRGRSPLHLAVTLGHLDCARILLQQGADVSKQNHSGWTGECVTLHTLQSVCCLRRDISDHHLWALFVTGPLPLK